MSNQIVLFDFEVFKYDTLLGIKVIDDTGIHLKQSWNLDDIKFWYKYYNKAIWIGHNNDAYDNHILAHIVKNGKDIFKKSKSLINSKFRGKADLDIITYDLMCCRFYSLKMTELLTGKSIHTSEVDFNLDRPLTLEEKRLVEKYNEDDLIQTCDNFFELKDIMILRLNLIAEFKIDKKFLTATEAKLASLALHAKQIPGIEDEYIAPKIYDTLKVKNQKVIDFYLSEGFRKGQNIDVVLCGVEHRMGAGGIHAAKKKYSQTDMLYLDVSGYYNLVMILYDLLPRTIPEEGRKLYKYMYHQQLEMKGKPELSTRRGVYKTILLAVFGASMNEYTDFYDPQVGSLITIVGQMFLVDLLEKLDGKIDLIQSNTDGIIVKPLPEYTEEDILAIVKEWCNRTGFVIKPKKIKELYQRDVNCYCYNTEDSWDVKGDAFVGSWGMETPVKHELYSSKEPPIVSLAVKEYFLNKIKPEQTIEDYKDNLRYFQYLCKKLSYDYCMFETMFNDGTTVSKNVADLNRCFALSDNSSSNYIVKYKTKDNKVSHSKIPNMPDNYFIFNENILEENVIKELQKKIDFSWYIDRAYKRIREFLDIDTFKELI